MSKFKKIKHLYRIISIMATYNFKIKKQLQKEAVLTQKKSL